MSAATLRAPLRRRLSSPHSCPRLPRRRPRETSRARSPTRPGPCCPASHIGRNIGRGLTKEVVSNASGNYVLPFLPTGEYEITFALAGFNPYGAQHTLHVNDRLALDAQLGGRAVTEIGRGHGRGAAHPAHGAGAEPDGPTQVQELPLNNRNFVQLATLVPGVSSDLADEVGIGLASTVSISINGRAPQRASTGSWTARPTSTWARTSRCCHAHAGVDRGVQDHHQQLRGGVAAQRRRHHERRDQVGRQGRSAARAYEFFRNDALNANSFFRKQSTDPDRSATSPPKLDYHNFGYTLGGPILKDKLFFFFSQEWRKHQRAPPSLDAPTCPTRPGSPIPPTRTTSRRRCAIRTR